MKQLWITDNERVGEGGEARDNDRKRKGGASKKGWPNEGNVGSGRRSYNNKRMCGVKDNELMEEKTAVRGKEWM